MALAIILVLLIICFLFFKRQVGVPFVAMIAGLAVYNGFGTTFAEFINKLIPVLDLGLVQNILYLIFVAIIPLVLYFRMGHSCLLGAVRIIGSIIFALMITVLVSGIVSTYLSFDTLTGQIVGWISGIRGILMVVGVIFAYVEIFLSR